MSGTAFDVRARAELRAVASKTAACHAERCNKDRCGLDLTEAPSERVIVDMDCDDLKILDGESRCDYVFIGREHSNVCVVPIELKSGGLKASAVLNQLAGGAKAADCWLSPGIPFRFIPVLVHGKKLHRQDLKTLRSQKVKLREQRKQVQLVRCGGSLANALR